jgi:predicted enzyme related to lactoylglutathione lyase
MWVTGRAPMTAAGLIISVMIADAAAALEAIQRAGGQIALPLADQTAEQFPWFRDPAGNVLSIYQQSGPA